MNATVETPQIPLEDRAYVFFFRRGGNPRTILPRGYGLVSDGIKGTKAYIGFTDGFHGNQKKTREGGEFEHLDPSYRNEYDTLYFLGMKAWFFLDGIPQDS